MRHGCRHLIACLVVLLPATTSADAASIEVSTFLGGSRDDVARAIARAPDGGTVIIGQTESPDFPTVRAFQSASIDKGPHRISDGFVTKLDGAGQEIEFSSFLGGSSRDRPAALAVDPAGNIYIAGWTDSPDFPVVGGLDLPAGRNHGFLTKISPDGRDILFSTRLEVVPEAIAFERNGRVFIAGGTFLPVFDVPSDPSTPHVYSAVVARVDTLRSRVSGFALVGGSDEQSVSHLAWDAKRNILWAGGVTLSADFPLRRPVRKVSDFEVGDDGFGTGFLLRFEVTKSALRLKSSSLLPGPLQALAVDRKGRPHLTMGSDDHEISGWEDILGTGDTEPLCPGGNVYFRIQASGRQLQNAECPPIYTVTEIAVDRGGRVVFAGTASEFENAPLADPVQATIGDSLGDVYVAVLAKGARRTLFGTYLGGRGLDVVADGERSGGLLISPSGDEISVAGWTTSRDFPVVTPVQAEKFGGIRKADAFVTRLRPFD